MLWHCLLDDSYIIWPVKSCAVFPQRLSFQKMLDENEGFNRLT